LEKADDKFENHEERIRRIASLSLACYIATPPEGTSMPPAGKE
jgi:hypothetical protein